MKPERINQLIAEWEGWKWYRIPHSEKGSRGPLRALFLPPVEGDDFLSTPADMTERVASMDYMHRDGKVPDYYHDLNAIQRAVMNLPHNKADRFCDELLRVTNKNRRLEFGPRNELPGDSFAFACADASERCEALLRTIGKWEEE